MNPSSPLRYFLILSAFVGATLLQAADLNHLEDGFSEPKMAGRRASRGEWSFVDGTAKCTQDDALYKKYKDHGPIIFYDLPHQDCEVSYRFKPEGAKNVVFTINGEEGHIFRFVTGEKHTDIRLFPPGPEHKSISGGRSPEMGLKEGQWTEVKVTLKGEVATVKIGDAEAMMVTHPSLNAPKANISIGFSFGALSLQGFSVDYQ